ncbi:hypothetical protein A3203_12255 [Burkholderia cenocepacia]|uniref:hypothetical protein n=1 Tax=Burkholderia cenocepacia TaxID=95486 RepID=UPI00078C474A|nr:hypothetical protein [Burkholderia cenocepacia]AMU13818.1 hypothetical protein A3203_12255 [Burkholderia cenocepacia]
MTNPKNNPNSDSTNKGVPTRDSVDYGERHDYNDFNKGFEVVNTLPPPPPLPTRDNSNGNDQS